MTAVRTVTKAIEYSRSLYVRCAKGLRVKSATCIKTSRNQNFKFILRELASGTVKFSQLSSNMAQTNNIELKFDLPVIMIIVPKFLIDVKFPKSLKWRGQRPVSIAERDIIQFLQLLCIKLLIFRFPSELVKVKPFACVTWCVWIICLNKGLRICRRFSPHSASLLLKLQRWRL